MKKLKLLLLIALPVIWMGCGSQGTETASYTAEEIEKETEKANRFFEKSFADNLDRSPMFQTYLGIKKDYDKWDDLTEERVAANLEITKKELQYLLDSINSEALSTQAKISYALFRLNAENDIADHIYRHHNYPINQMFGLHSRVPSMLINLHLIADQSHAEAYIARLQGTEVLFDQLIEGLKIREEKGVLIPKFVFPRVLDDIKNILKGQPFDNGEPGTLFADFTSKVEKLNIEEEKKKELLKNGKNALLTKVKPAYEKLIAFLTEQETRATDDDGAWKLPNGAAYYENALNRTTTTSLTAEEIHQTGLKEVDRIHGEMKEIMKQVGFEGDLQAFFSFLKEDDQFYYPNTDEAKMEYMDSAKVFIDNMESRLDELFITKPKAKVVVKRVEDFREKSAGKAFYQAPAPDGSRPGTYYVNLYNSKNMPKFEMEALAYHEGIPGHHMDRTISQELTDIPRFRKFGGYTAYVEGWGLYCEYLPKEMGMYSNPYSDYGRLAMELWRACRLVVDTGIHLKKWTRQQGVDYYLTNTSATERECVRMVERHIVMPSQATAYKIGMLKILELRQHAKDQLGENFDIREFHDVVLTSGAVPLSTLEDLVATWIASK